MKNEVLTVIYDVKQKLIISELIVNIFNNRYLNNGIFSDIKKIEKRKY